MSQMNKKAIRGWIGGAAIALLATIAGPVSAQDTTTPQQRLRSGASVDLAVLLFKSRIVTLDAPVGRVSVGNPDIADIVVIRPTELYVLGKDIGTTNVFLWDRDNEVIGSINVEVTHDLSSLKAKLHQLLPGQTIQVHSAQRSVVLTGAVPDAATMNAAVRMAEGYLAQVQTAKNAETFEQESQSQREDKAVGQVINLLQIGGAQQVMLEVKVAEIARTELKRLNARFNAFAFGGNWSGGGVNGGATFPDLLVSPGNFRVPVFPGSLPGGSAGPAVDEFAPNDLTIEDQGLFASYLSSDFLFNLAIDAAKEKGLAKILAEPTLTTLTGQEAKFLSGGEFPIPVPQGLDSVTIEFKEFGVGLKFLPVVLNSGHINLKVNVSVSELSDCSSVVIESQTVSRTFLVPCLQKRDASGTIELGDGQTMGLAGLISDNLRQTVTKFPGLGSLPVIGALFRSQQYLKGETELVILVTPRLAKPLPPGQIRLPTDSFIEPSDAEFYFLGRMEGKGSGGAPKSDGGGHEVK
jgi:pilus assembly protein CpaC